MGRKSGIEKLRNNNYLRTIDYYLVVPILLLTIIGLYVLNKVLSHGYAAYPNNLYRQIASAVAGIIIICTSAASWLSAKSGVASNFSMRT